mgnify:CR=1 FL=1
MLGIASVMAVAWVMKMLRRDKSEHALMLELPSYRMPNPRDVLIGLQERAMIFLRRVGGIILTLTVLLWFLLNFPGAPAGAVGPAIDYSFAGRIGHFMQPLFAPIGFNWQICIAQVPGLAAREVAVSSLATVYAISGGEDVAAEQLGIVIAAQWQMATAFSLLAWYVFAPQCLSTLAVIRRVLADEAGPARDIVVLNAGAAIHVAGLAATLAEGVARAQAVIASGAAAGKLDQLVSCTRRLRDTE